MRTIEWTRNDEGYEVSTKGDKRFSAFVAKMPDGRTIEQHYQCDVKLYQPGGIEWRLGKGRPALNPDIDLFAEYLKLWKIWAANNPDLIEELLEVVKEYNDTLKDRFATTRVNQANALAVILNEKLQTEESQNE